MPQTLKKVCPQCNCTLTISHVSGVENKILTCPSCKYRAVVSSYPDAPEISGQTEMVQCPQCHKNLTISYTPGIESKMLTCPSCKYRAMVRSFIRMQTCDDPTEVAECLTRVGTRSVGELKPGFLKIREQSYPLHEGANTIGRKARTGTASIQVDGDVYMSRLQGTFYVEKTTAGYRYRYEELKASNHTTVRGTVLNEGDVIAVGPEDILVMGETSVQLCYAKDDECTQIKR